MQKLWGDNYFNPAAKKFTTEPSAGDGTELPRCFVQFIMKPIIILIRNVMDGQLDTVWKMLENL
jgi:elongation factor 2